MTGRPAKLGSKAADHLAVQIGHLAGREIPGQNNRGRCQMIEAAMGLPQQGPQQMPLNVQYVIRPIGNHRIGQPPKHLGELPQHKTDGFL